MAAFGAEMVEVEGGQGIGCDDDEASSNGNLADGPPGAQDRVRAFEAHEIERFVAASHVRAF
jgi:hypothetical protein